jgi:hypothetical protein
VKLWSADVRWVMEALLGLPADPLMELVLVAAVACLVLVLVLNALTRLMSFPRSGVWLAALVMLLGVVIVLVTGVAARVYLAPLDLVRQWKLVPWLPFLAVAVSIPALVAPAMMLTHRARYSQCVTALLLSAGAMAMTVLLANSLMGAVLSGDKDLTKTRDRTRTINRFLND